MAIQYKTISCKSKDFFSKNDFCSDSTQVAISFHINEIILISKNPRLDQVNSSFVWQHIVNTNFYKCKIKRPDKKEELKQAESTSDLHKIITISFCSKKMAREKAEIQTMIKCILAADAMCFCITSFRKMISVSFIVISSSFLV